jgi:hypothetical protein
MVTAIEGYRPRASQNYASGLARLDDNIKAPVLCRNSVRNDVPVGPFNHIADLHRSINNGESHVLDDELKGCGMDEPWPCRNEKAAARLAQPKQHGC